MGPGCYDVVNLDTDCGCGAICNTPLQKCCVDTGNTPVPGISVCTALNTTDNCGDCAYICEANLPPNSWATCCTIANPMGPLPSDIWQCKDLKYDHDNCGKCGRVCGDREVCCEGECQDFSLNDNCGGCAVLDGVHLCAPDTTCCLEDPVMNIYSCQAFSNADVTCGCVGNTQDCTMLAPPDENHDSQYNCCRGTCAPKWFDCVD